MFYFISYFLYINTMIADIIHNNFHNLNNNNIFNVCKSVNITNILLSSSSIAQNQTRKTYFISFHNIINNISLFNNKKNDNIILKIQWNKNKLKKICKRKDNHGYFCNLTLYFKGIYHDNKQIIDGIIFDEKNINKSKEQNIITIHNNNNKNQTQNKKQFFQLIGIKFNHHHDFLICIKNYGLNLHINSQNKKDVKKENNQNYFIKTFFNVLIPIVLICCIILSIAFFLQQIQFGKNIIECHFVNKNIMNDYNFIQKEQDINMMIKQ